MRLRFYLFILILLSITGCSSREIAVTSVSPDSFDNFPIIGLTQTDAMFNSLGLFGAYELVIEPDDLSAELVVKRYNTIGESFIVNGKGFFTIFPCPDCLKLKAIETTADSDFVLHFSIQHPFEMGDPNEEPTGINRKDLNVFDLALVVHPVEASSATFNLLGKSAYSEVCSDPDGYTTELSELINNSAALPYFLVIDESAVLPHTWNVFEMGETADFDVKLKQTAIPVRLDLYLTMGYGASARRPERLNPKYYNPEFNRKAAWKVTAAPPNGDNQPQKGNTWEEFDSTTRYDITIEVFDWQMEATVSQETDFGNSDPSHVYASSKVDYVTVEIPGMTNSLTKQYTPDSGTGLPGDPLIYTISIANQNLLPAGEYTSLVKVVDERLPLDPSKGRDFLIDSPNGVDLIYYEIDEYTTYQTFTATIVPGCGPISGNVVEPECPITSVYDRSLLDFVVSAQSIDGGNPIVLYEIDYDFDGVSFTSDRASTNGVFNDIGPFSAEEPCLDNIPRTYDVAFRATDSCIPPNVEIFATCEVTVDNCFEPVGNVTITVNRTGSNGYIVADEPWTLEWEPANGAEEYAIYVDIDPGDLSLAQLTDEWLFITVVPGSVTGYTFPGIYLSSVNGWIKGYTFTVRSREIAGDPDSESENSELAFLMINQWDTLSDNQTIGNNAEGWVAGIDRNAYVYGVTAYYYNPIATEDEYLSDPLSLRVIPQLLGMIDPGRQVCVTVETPVDIPDADTRFIESGILYDGYYPVNPEHQGYAIVGTSEVLLGLNWTSLNSEDFHWAEAEEPPEYRGYTGSYSGIPFGNIPSSGDTAWVCNTYFHRNLVAAYLNLTEPYAGFAVYREEYYAYSNFYLDDTAIMIY